MDLHVYRNSQDRWHDLKRGAEDRGAILGPNAVTLGELVERLTPGVRVVTAAQKLVLVHRALENLAEMVPLPLGEGGRRPGEGTERRSRGSAGAVRYAFDAISDLKAAGVIGHNEMLAAYDAELHRAGLIDTEDRCWLAARNAKQPGRWLARFERVVIHAIYDLTEAEFALLSNVIEVLPDGGTVILFNTTANVKPTQFAEWTWRRFIQNEELAERTFPEFCRPSSPNRDLLERLFVFDIPKNGEVPQLLDPNPSLEILQTPGRYREVEIIGGRIADLLDRGESASDVAVVVRHIETYGEMIEDVFSRYAIPHHFDTGVPLLRVPFIKYWFALLDLVTGERSRNSLARVLSSAYFLPRMGSGLDVERELAAFGYIDRLHLPASDLARRKSSALTPELERLEVWLDRLEGSSETILGFLNQFVLPSMLTTRDRQAWQILSDELAEADALSTRIGFEQFRRLAAEIAAMRTTDRFTSATPPVGFPRVRIMSPRALGSRSYRWIFSPGHADGEIPAYSSANPLLPDDVIEDLNRRIWPQRLLTSRDRRRSEPLFLFMLLDSAEKRVTLTFPGKTLEGEPIYPSSYLLEISRHFAAPVIAPVESSPSIREIGECRRKIAEEWRAGSIDDRGAAELLGKDVMQRVKREASGAARGNLSPGTLSLDGVWHPSELNSLASCPFIFLARNRLRLRTEEIPDFEVPAMEVGRLAHEILRGFYATPVPPLLPEARARMDSLIEQHLAALDVSGQGSSFVFDPSLWRIRRRQLVAALHEYVTFAVRDAFDGYETLPQYLDAPLPPALMGSIQLGGRPDHVAVRRAGERVDGIRIDDFKYSAASSATNKLLKDSFQIPVYAYLAARMLDVGPEAQIEGRYLLLKSPSTPVVSHAIDTAVFEDVREKIELLLEKVRSGRLAPDPAPGQDCTSCNYRRLCRLYGG